MNWQATLLAERDNVAVALVPIAAGTTVTVQTPRGLREVVATEAIPLCHKLAIDDIDAGSEVLKYGDCIGEARTAIRRGAWVHVHNLVSRRAKPLRGGSR
jgi:altronate dehydratase